MWPLGGAPRRPQLTGQSWSPVHPCGKDGLHTKHHLSQVGGWGPSMFTALVTLSGPSIHHPARG